MDFKQKVAFFAFSALLLWFLVANDSFPNEVRVVQCQFDDHDVMLSYGGTLKPELKTSRIIDGIEYDIYIKDINNPSKDDYAAVISEKIRYELPILCKIIK